MFAEFLGSVPHAVCRLELLHNLMVSVSQGGSNMQACMHSLRHISCNNWLGCITKCPKTWLQKLFSHGSTSLLCLTLRLLSHKPSLLNLQEADFSLCPSFALCTHIPGASSFSSIDTNPIELKPYTYKLI